MKKKVLALFMAAAMTAGLLAGCGSEAANSAGDAGEAGTSQTESAASGDTAASGKVYHIGICQLLEHDALDAATKGFQDALVKLVGENNVTFDFQNAQGEQPNCATICNQFVSDNVD
ncbi:MAG: ABC transporter substrate-binding protein, partial [Lachnospiraceae bacterium]|nr:ABC transporter substrate-binding protein [Lachnospiraceae bacterium]